MSNDSPWRQRATSPDALPFRAAPHNLEVEQALLGAILVNNEALDRVSGFIEPHHFFDPLHGAIYQAAAKLIGDGRQANPITLKTFFEGAEPIGSVPVPAYLGQLAANATTIINVRDYARTVRDLAIRRALILIGEDMVNVAYDSPVDFPPKEQIEEVERRLYGLAEHGDGGGTEVTAAQMQAEAMAYIEEASRGAVVALPMGLTELDRYRLMRPGRLIVLAGRPSMGKTSLATDVTRVQEVTVHFFSAEMTTVEIGMRRFSVETGLSSDHLDGGNLSSDDWGRMHRRGEEAQHAEALHRPNRRPHHRPAQHARQAREAPARHGLDRRRLPAAPARHQARQPRRRGLRDHRRPQGARQGAERAGAGPIAALARGRRAARTNVRSSPTCATAAASSRTPTLSCSCSARSTTWSASNAQPGS